MRTRADESSSEESQKDDFSLSSSPEINISPLRARVLQEQEATFNKVKHEMEVVHKQALKKLEQLNILYQTIQKERDQLTSEHQKNLFLLEIVNKPEIKSAFEEIKPTTKALPTNVNILSLYEPRLASFIEKQINDIVTAESELYEKWMELKAEAVLADVAVTRHNLVPTVTFQQNVSGNINTLFTQLRKEREQIQAHVAEETESNSYDFGATAQL